MTSMFQFGSRQRSGVDAKSTARQTSSAASNSTATYSTRDIGAMLRERREAMGVTLAEAEAATRIRQKYVAALESDEWHLLPGEVVGRGFLRNYAAYLGLEPTDVIDRRRSITDDRLSATLANTSAGSSLPPIRQVDYRPKEVDLLDEDEGMETREVRLTPIFAVLGALLLVALLWWGRDALMDVAASTADSLQALTVRPTATLVVPTVSVPAAAVIVNPENAAQLATDGNAGNDAPGDASDNTTAGSAPDDGANALILVPTPTPTPAPPTPTDPAAEATATPTETPVPLPTPTPVADAAAPPDPVLLPTDAADGADDAAAAPEEEPPAEEPVVVAPVCPDPRSLISSPGVNQVVSGVVGITGTATHEAFQYYKLEYAPGANAGGGFVYFDGGNAPVNGGLLGGLNTGILANGFYTVQLIVVDASGNFPPPCTVTIDIRN